MLLTAAPALAVTISNPTFVDTSDGSGSSQLGTPVYLPLPEPRADALLALALIGLGWFDRRQRR